MKKLPVILALTFVLVSCALAQRNCPETAREIAPQLSDAARKTYETKLAEARRQFEKTPEAADAVIWLGRRTAYLGNYREAIRIFTGGLEKFPSDPRFYRHRGHRFLTLRCFDEAARDFEKAAKLVRGKPDEIEPDGLPNARNTPTSTLQSNIFYHLGLAFYLKGDFKAALKAYRECEKVSKNADMMVATKHWLYMTLRRLGKTKEASESVAGVKDGLDIIENTDYYKLIKLYQGKLKAEDLLKEIGAGEADTLSNASVGYGVGNWFLYNGEREKAEAIFRQIVGGNQWSSFGFIAAEAELFEENAAGENSSCVKVELIEQKKLPPDNKKLPPDYIDTNPDDIIARFRLTNNCRKTIYYLATNYDKEPTGFMIYRTESEGWKARTPSWGRERNLTGSGIRWLLLQPGNSVETHFTDLSRIKGERSIAIYINRFQNHIGSLEIRVNPYQPIEIK